MKFRKEDLTTITFTSRPDLLSKLSHDTKLDSKRTVGYEIQRDGDNNFTLEVTVTIHIKLHAGRKKLADYAGFKRSQIIYDSFIVDDERADLLKYLNAVLAEGWLFVMAVAPNKIVEPNDSLALFPVCDEIIASLKNSGFYD